MNSALGARAMLNRRQCALLSTLAAAVLLLSACHRTEVARGEAVYTANCQSCHGPQGEGENPAHPWGSLMPQMEGFVAPALDGRGHCWYHTEEELIRIIQHGSGVEGSPMPAWNNTLDEGEIQAVVAYIHSLWPRRLRNYAKHFSQDELNALRTEAESAIRGSAPAKPLIGKPMADQP